MKQHSIISKLQLILPLLIIFICAFGFLFAPNDPDLVDMTIKFLPPCAEYPLGTDNLGRCVLSRLLYGGQTTLGIVLVGSVTVSGLGTLAGLLMGGGKHGKNVVLEGVLNAVTAIPPIAYLIIFIAAWGNSVFIRNLEHGYDTVCGSGGGHLSGGEKQRISIARAMLKNAPIIILDEATASIDPENEALIQRAISALTVGKTLIVIAHRLSTIVNADNIVVIEHGTIVAQGKQEQLIRDCPLYAGMWNAHLGTQDSN